MPPETTTAHSTLSIESVTLLTALVVFSILIDLRAHRDKACISVRDAARWSLFWVALGCSFGGYVYLRYGACAASLYMSGYVLEKSLSIDNLMVFIAVFSYFKIRGALQHRILYYGIIAAIVFRLIFVSAGGLLMRLGPWADALFALIVGWSAVKMVRSANDDDGDDDDYSDHAAVRFISRFFAVVPVLDGSRFFVDRRRAEELAREHSLPLTRSAKRYATPALVCLAVIELSDVLFSFDSVPTVIAVTHEPLLIYSAMIFAILGLRSLYFVLAALTRHLLHLEKAIIALLFFIAAKLGLHAVNELLHWPRWEPTPLQSLTVILTTLVLGVVASRLFPEPRPSLIPSERDH